MGLRFSKKIKIAKGLNINLSRSGFGLLAGIPGLRIGAGPKGVYGSAGIPGTGLSMMSYLKNPSSGQKNGSFTGQSNASDGFSIKIPSDVKSNYALGGVFIIICIVCLVIKWWLFFIAFFVLSLLGNILSRSIRAKPIVKKANKFIAKENWPKLIETISKLIKIYPTSQEMKAYLGMAYLLAGNTHEGISTLEGYIASVTPEKGNVRIYLANAYYKSKQYDKALSHFDKLSTEYKALLCIQNMIADCYLQTSKTLLAITVLENGPMNSKDSDKDHLEYQYLLTKAYLSKGETDKARKQASKVYVMENSYKDIAQIASELKIL